MAQYDLDRFSVVVVEDNSYRRLLLARVLRALGVSTIRPASDGGEAIELLRLLTSDPIRAGLMNLDLILSDWLMALVDGLALLQWVCQHKHSPNHHLPFIMVSGYANAD